MTERYSTEEISRYWSEQAQKHGQSPSASWSDQNVIELEIREILKYLEDGDQVLDVGCANGYSTVQFAARKKMHVRGVDYIPEMVRQARQRLEGLADRLAGMVEFDTGDAMALQEPSQAYDKVVSIRVIINLGDWEKQLQGLQECARVLKPGGLFLLSEATLQGWSRLNKFRNEWGLADIPMPSFNNYLDREKVTASLSPQLQLVEVVHFASSYYVGTRLFKPLLVKALGLDMNIADPNAEWNRWCAQLPAWGEYGTQELFVFRKQ